jgi:myo-inositol-1(or 4)-monophosphatase
LPERDLALLTSAAHTAGRIAMRYWKASPQVWEKPGLGPVTEADLAVNAMLAETLRVARPGYGWLSEETPDDTARDQYESMFIIDPIDGTRAFIAGDTHFSHSLAVARSGQITAAVVYLPALDLLYSATQDGMACLNGLPIACASQSQPDGANLLISKAALGADHWHGPVPKLKRHFRASLAYRLCLVADGSFDGMLTLRDSWEWDIAAGSLICQRAGAQVTDREGQSLTFNSAAAKTKGVLVAPPALHAALRQRMNP